MMAAVLVFGSAAGLGLLGFGWARQRLQTSQLVKSAGSGNLHLPACIDFTTLDGLPEPLARYFHCVLRHGQPYIRWLRLQQEGRLRTAPETTRWMRFRASHVLAPASADFVWDARVTIGPLLHVRVRDAYVHGVGSGLVSLLSAVPVSRVRGGLEMNSGSLHRYLAEAEWCPTALLPCPDLVWTPIDRHKALATLTKAGVSVSLEFRFNETGEIVGVYSPARWGRFGGRFEQVPWEGHFRDYRERHGMRIPSYGEVGWYRAGQWRCVWEGRILDASYGLAD